MIKQIKYLLRRLKSSRVMSIRHFMWRTLWQYKRHTDPYIDYLRISHGINGVGKTINKEKQKWL